ncbi:Hypothetical predicted protein [Pelobates cultripes]|uniref:Uncharacterized protein n=1 Tax=Pelobates cultripes TaxID=61616 RepID=A0AAD1T049_PELCU|nr:Hypothetical predicted protein [Pelobates cultripes]
MVSVLKAFFTSELAVLKEELGTLTGRIRVTEDEVHNLRVKQDYTTKQVLEISTKYEQLNTQVGQLEDSAHQSNLKVNCRNLSEGCSLLYYRQNRPRDCHLMDYSAYQRNPAITTLKLEKSSCAFNLTPTKRASRRRLEDKTHTPSKHTP